MAGRGNPGLLFVQHWIWFADRVRQLQSASKQLRQRYAHPVCLQRSHSHLRQYRYLRHSWIQSCSLVRPVRSTVSTHISFPPLFNRIRNNYFRLVVVVNCLHLNSDKGLIGERFPGLVVNGSLSDEAYANFLEFREESKDLGLRGCNLEAIMNEVYTIFPVSEITM